MNGRALFKMSHFRSRLRLTITVPAYLETPQGKLVLLNALGLLADGVAQACFYESLAQEIEEATGISNAQPIDCRPLQGPAPTGPGNPVLTVIPEIQNHCIQAEFALKAPMKSSWKIAASILAAAALCGATIILYVQKTGDYRRLAEEAATCRRDAERGDAKAEERLGSMYYYARGVTQDYGEALRWYRESAEQGDTQAKYDVGLMYDSGIGVQQNYAEALRWYRQGAVLGERVPMQHGLAVLLRPRGPARPIVAAAWYNRSCFEGLARAHWPLRIFMIAAKVCRETQWRPIAGKKGRPVRP